MRNIHKINAKGYVIFNNEILEITSMLAKGGCK